MRVWPATRRPWDCQTTTGATKQLRREFDVRDRRTIRLEDESVDPTWAPGVEGPTQLELPLAPGEQPPASLVA